MDNGWTSGIALILNRAWAGARAWTLDEELSTLPLSLFAWRVP